MSDSRLTELLKQTPLHVTGMGAWAPGGTCVAELWQSVLAGQGLAVWKDLPASVAGGRLPVCVAGTPDPRRTHLRKMRRMDRSAALAVMAAWEAWQDAGLDRRAPDPGRIAIIAGTSRGPVEVVSEAFEQLRRGRMFPSTAAHATLASLSGTLATLCGASGPCFVVSSACSSSATAIATAAQLLCSGVVDIALAGGADAPLHPVILAQLHAAGVLATHADPAEACRPFDTARSGTVLGEGAAFLVLETEASARERGRPSHCRLAGWGMTTEPGERAGFSASNPGLCRAMRQALALAALEPARIGYVNAHGTGTFLNDAQEAAAIARVFGGQTQPVVSSTKPVTGHCMGGIGALEAVIAIQALRTGQVPPTPNCDTPDAEGPARLVRHHPLPCATDAVMTNSSGFWGSHTSLVFTQTHEL